MPGSSPGQAGETGIGKADGTVGRGHLIEKFGAGAEASWLKREPAISRLCDKQFALVA